MIPAWIRKLVWSFFSRNVDSLGYVGAALFCIVVVCLSLYVWNNVKAFILAPRFKLGVDLSKLGEWAVVTGASDGIGRAYAIQLARKKLNVVLISRCKQKLDSVAAEIESESGVKTRCIVADFRGGLDVYRSIEAQLVGLDIAILVNNVGINNPPGYFCDLNDQEVLDVIMVNCGAVTFMTKMILPKLVAKKKGVIVNVGSQYGSLPGPLVSMYSATKAYVDLFSQAMTAEYQSTGVIIQTLVPSFTATRMIDLSPNFTVPSAMELAESAISTIGVQSRSVGNHKFLPAAVMQVLPMPDRIKMPMMRLMGRLIQSHMQRVERRRQQQQQQK